MWGVLEGEETVPGRGNEGGGTGRVALGKGQGENQGSDLEEPLALQLARTHPRSSSEGHTGTCFLHTGEPRSPFERCFRGRE